ncbi:MAG: DUF721 domain-containing protein [Chthoniobacterales bacterium]
MNPKFRHRALEEWRGLPLNRPTKDRTVAVSDIIGKTLAKFGLEERLKEAEVLAAWRDVVGDFLAKHSKPNRLVDGVLLVQVTQPAIHYELERTWKTEILRKFRLRFGNKIIREIRFRV